VNNQFHGFHTSISEVGNQKSRYGSWEFTDFTDFTPSEMGVYVAPAHARTLARARCHTYPISTNREIREIREFARRQWGNFRRFSPPGVKRVKLTVGIDIELIQ
jgi:hypothetical protein